MITSRFPLGDVSFSAEYFSTLVGEATKQCYGVAAMTPRDLTDAVRSVVRGSDYAEKGVRDRAAHCRQLRAQHLHRRAQHLAPRQGRSGAGHRPEGCPRDRVGGRRDRLMELFIKE